MREFPVRISTVLLTLGLASVVSAQGQPAEVFWADLWNQAYHHFTDLDGDGTFLGADEVTFLVDPDSPTTANALGISVTEEDGQLVAYWFVRPEQTIIRGVDLDRDGQFLGGEEISVYRDSGVLDGNGIIATLDITDDGAVWWSSAFLISQPQNGLARLEDLNDDSDAGDPDEQVLMVDGNGEPQVEHDQGSAPIASPWAIQDIAAAGNGVIAYTSDDDQVVYRFEDFNDDGDVLDAGESILMLNATGARPDLPMNPDFQDGTLRSLENQLGYYARFIYLASAVENGERAYYFGTDSLEEGGWSLNVLGQGINFLIFRGVDGNGDGDVNDAGEVNLFFDGSRTDGKPNLFSLRALDVLDGGIVYAVGITRWPTTLPADPGNAWIHRFEDLNGDGDALDAGEQQLEIFDLQVYGSTELFPIPWIYGGQLMADPRDISVYVRSSRTSPGDFDADGVVGVTDLLFLLAAWGTPDADLDGDGTTSVGDLLALLSAWGPS